MIMSAITSLTGVNAKRVSLQLVVVVTMLGCSGSAERETGVLQEDVVSAADVLRLAQQSARNAAPITAKQFNDANPMGWTGRAHNALVQEFIGEFGQTGKEKCKTFERLYLRGAFLKGDSTRLSRAQRVATLPDLLRGAGCTSRFASSLQEPAPFALAPVARVSANVASGDPTPYMTAIEDATEAASSANALAATVAAIISQAESTLSGQELDAVYTIASIAVSSAEYWEANTINDYELLEPSIAANCFTVDGEPNPCEYDAAQWSAMDARPPVVFRLASIDTRARSSCWDILSPWTIASIDATAGVVALISTWSPAAAVAAGTAASANGFIRLALLFFGCVMAS
jgi:hypothetical protein